MGLRAVLIDRPHRLVTAAAVPSSDPVPLEPTPRREQYPDPVTRAIAEQKAAMWAGSLAESIPAVRRAVRLICGTLSTWRLVAWRDGVQLPAAAIPWLGQPDPDRTSQDIIAASVHDGVWLDRAVWRPVPGGYRRVNPARLVEIPAADPDDPPAITLDGRPLPAGSVVIRWGGAGGLRTLGVPLLALMGDVFAAAGRYAASPEPNLILKNTGVDIDPPDIDALLTDWDDGRAKHTAGYLGAYLEAIQLGYSAKDLQLVEAMDALTKDVARLFGLPAAALGVSAGDSLTYATTIEQRRDLLESLRPWRVGVEQTLSAGEYAVHLGESGVTAVRRGRYVPWGTSVAFDTSDFEREGWSTRLDTLGRAIAAVGPDGRPLLTVDEARDLEPTITAVRPSDTGM